MNILYFVASRSFIVTAPLCHQLHDSQYDAPLYRLPFKCLLLNNNNTAAAVFAETHRGLEAYHENPDRANRGSAPLRIPN